jgi:DNA invertase Pin-like site-specific DNA recombinase
VTKLDRLGRQVPDIRQTIDALKARGVRVIVLNVGGGVLDMRTSGGKLTVNALAMVAEHEGDIISERTSEAMQWMKKNGHRISQSPGLGRKLVPVSGALTKKNRQKYTTAWDPEQLRIIREIVERHDCGETFAEIAASLLARGVRDELGVVWGAPNPKQKVRYNGAPRTKKVRRAYPWYKAMQQADKLPPQGSPAKGCSVACE